ncbi:MAG: MarR family transcriptional regulator [Actinomycetota bacterium]
MTRTSAASVSSLVQGLERRGLVERRTEDGDERSKRVYATTAGEELIAGFDVAMADLEGKILAPLSADERDTFHSLLVKITSQLPRPTR